MSENASELRTLFVQMQDLKNAEDQAARDVMAARAECERLYGLHWRGHDVGGPLTAAARRLREAEESREHLNAQLGRNHRRRVKLLAAGGREWRAH